MLTWWTHFVAEKYHYTVEKGSVEAFNSTNESPLEEQWACLIYAVDTIEQTNMNHNESKTTHYRDSKT